MWRKYLWYLLTVVVLGSTVAVARFVTLQAPLLTQCLDNVPPPCFRQTRIIRDCCIYMGLPGYFRETWNVGLYRHPNAPLSVWYRRESRITASGTRCTPMQPLTCREIPILYPQPELPQMTILK